MGDIDGLEFSRTEGEDEVKFEHIAGREDAVTRFVPTKDMEYGGNSTRIDLWP